MMRRLKSFASGRSSSVSEQVILIHTNKCIRVYSLIGRLFICKRDTVSRLGNQINQSKYNIQMYVCAPVIFVSLTILF